jgi:hypothetical protein
MASITHRSALARNLTANEVDANFDSLNTEVTAATAAIAGLQASKQDKLTAGANISIASDGTISASGSLSSVNSTGITDSTTVGRALITAVDAASGRTTLGLGSIATQSAATYATIASPALTGTPSTPTASVGTNTTQIASCAFVAGEIGALKGSAPATLDTLQELAAAINNDPAYNTTITAAIAARGDMSLGTVQTVTAAKTYNPNTLKIAGSTSGAVILAVPAVAGTGTVTLPLSGTLLAGSDVVNDLTTGGTAVPLSAEQGKTLNTSKVSVSAIVNDLVTGGTAVPLSAEQGKTLQTNKAPLASPTFTGVPAAPTAAVGTNTTQLATCAFVRNELGSAVGGMAQDITAATYTGTTLNTYTLNGLTWTLAYNGDGTPNTETSGSLVKTYNYTSGNFTGITGAVNAGESRTCTLATLPSAANSAPGDRVFVTDVAKRVVGSTDQGNFGQMYQFVGATGTGKWIPMGSYSYERRVGSIATPIASLSTVSGSSQIVGTSLMIPAALLVPGNKFRISAVMHRTGAVAASNFITRFGQLNTTSDTIITLFSLSGTNNVSGRVTFDALVTSSTTILTTNILNSGSGAADGATGSTEHTINAANPVYFQANMGSVSSGDAYQLLHMEVEQIA